MQSDQKQHILKAVEQIQRTNEAHIIIRYKKKEQRLAPTFVNLKSNTMKKIT